MVVITAFLLCLFRAYCRCRVSIGWGAGGAAIFIDRLGAVLPGRASPGRVYSPLRAGVPQRSGGTVTIHMYLILYELIFLLQQFAKHFYNISNKYIEIFKVRT